MDLIDFSCIQELVVTRRARMIALKMSVNKTWDAEAGIKRELATIPELRGVSFREFVAEILQPGSFSNGRTEL